MDVQVEKLVRERAYHLWIESGRLQGLEHEHWCAAERDVAAQLAVTPVASKRATASKAKPAVVKTAKAKATSVVAKPAVAKAKSSKAAMSEARGSLN